MLIKLTETSQVAGSKWAKGTVLEAPESAAKKAIEDGVAKATTLDTKPDRTKKEDKKAK